ncbi:MAG: undecaprenyldiphospho-muramoylpentapeptide beta-N-acetylglucosaminyltransferase [Bilophila sp.]
MSRLTNARVILTTGGTGGHIFPALAVAERLRDAGVELLFIGSTFGPEGKLAQQAGVPFAGLPVHGVLGRGLRSVGALCGMAKAVFLARDMVRSFRPDVVVGFGAYASFAPLLAARLASIPVAVHEQNAMPGLTNRLLARLAQRVFLSLPDVTGAFSPAKCVDTGNPVRQAIVDLAQVAPTRTTTRRLLVMGGSQGAKAINSVVLASLGRLLAAGVEIRHQSGPGDLSRVLAGYTAHGYDASNVTPFIDNVAEAYTWADLVLCRAGATSVAELAVAGKASILVPFPYATHDHQTYNARVLAEKGAALMVAEKDMASRDMGGMLLNLLDEPGTLQVMAQAARGCACPDAAANVAREVLHIGWKGKQDA